MSYLNRFNGYAPTGRVNSEPVEAAAEGVDNPAFDTVEGDDCPACSAPALRRWRGGFADEPPAVPHTECVACGATT